MSTSAARSRERDTRKLSFPSALKLLESNMFTEGARKARETPPRRTKSLNKVPCELVKEAEWSYANLS